MSTEILLIAKSAEPEKRIVWGEVYAPNRPDSDGEFMQPATIEKMAYDFVRSGRTKMVDVGHNNQVTPGVEIVESFIARKGDPDFIPGSWVVAVHIPDDRLWEQVKKGEINGFSVEALVNYQEQERDIEMPPVVSGVTTKSEAEQVPEHVHKFYVTYDHDTGQFLGGVTDDVDGHFHPIVAGTVTEEAMGHRHRFSSVDGVEIQ